MSSLFDSLIPFEEATPEDNLDIIETPGEDIEEEIESPDDSGDDIVEDDRVAAVYQYLVESGFVTELEDFKATPENLEPILDSLPETLFTAALSGVHEDAQDLLDYSFKLGPDASVEKLKEFFDAYIAPAALEIETEEDAYNFLKEELKQTKVFRTETQLLKYLEDLQDSDELLDTAKEKLAEKKQALEDSRKAEIEAVKQAEIERENQSRQFYQNIYNTVDELNWDNKRKQVVLKNIEPKEVARKNELIMKSPMALVQLADLYSRFDEKTGQFDLTGFEMKTDSKKTQARKDELIKSKLESSLSKIRSQGKNSGDSSSGFFSQFSKT